MAEVAADSATVTDKVDGCVSSKVEKVEDSDKPTAETNGHGKETTPKNGKAEKQTEDNGDEDSPEAEPELYFPPKVSLPLVDVKTMEDNEDVVVELRSRIYRFDDSEDEPEFKERGTGVVKILRHKETNMYRILLRRDKTHKICANHYITSTMELNKHNNSDKVFVYSTLADLYDLETNPETFAIRFSNPENAAIFKKGFDEAVQVMKKKEKEIDELNKALEEGMNLEPKKEDQASSEASAAEPVSKDK
ncbi:PREDICTED: ran-specific GTPase-activating protein-like [Rhagoletis zephyria]|uniref:ran-specific GTPase-activating protein-like n=1 Tax=Rhagoletis zephyria TaxID=28612 RepID=UPI0008117CAE|nr:PREDICTED: ran-specific GTPase-activating protein-like [Rhagoletis zephyria]